MEKYNFVPAPGPIPLPGRRLDLLVAEKIMDWRWMKGWHNDCSAPVEPMWFLPPDMTISDVGRGEWCFYDTTIQDTQAYYESCTPDKPPRLTIWDVPRYSDSEYPQGVFCVIEKMRKHHLYVTIMNRAEGYSCRFDHRDHQIGTAWSDSFPYAVCMAALGYILLTRQIVVGKEQY